MGIKHSVGRWIAERRRRAALRDICELDERLLKDVGLCRADLVAALRRP
jgi:uncharacterized protein YjiS (DUF1127 family)